jgi:Holliday junction resolvase RusA-like endonuclease
VNLEIIVYGSPIAQPRARGRIFQTKGGKMAVGIYDPQTVKDKATGMRKVNPIYAWKQQVKHAALEALGVTEETLKPDMLWTGPISMNLEMFFPRIKELEKAKYPDGKIPYIKKPDRDNLEKGTLDAMKGIVFVDDCQICAGEVRKWYCERTSRPRAEIRIAQIHEQPLLAAARAKRKI